jgi:hypothetical protein
MKYFFAALLILFFVSTAQAGTLSGSARFDWVDLSQHQRNELIQEYRNVTMALDSEFSYSRADFANFRRDENFAVHRALLQDKVEETQDKTLVGFYRFGMLVAYAVREKAQPQNTFYYNALGRLIYVDIRERDSNGEFPYVAYQYRENGKLTGRIYNVSEYDQFMYDEKGKFLGRWYQNTMYDAKGKARATRSWW